MKPAPFEKIVYTDDTTQLRLYSTPKDNRTQLINTTGEVLWSMTEYVGRRRIFLSEDGGTLILFGNLYFGNTLKCNPSEIILSIFEQGRLQHAFSFSQVFGFSIDEAKADFAIPETGGGWINFQEYFKIEPIDWINKAFIIAIKDKAKRTILF